MTEDVLGCDLSVKIFMSQMISQEIFFLKFSHHFSPLLWGHRYCGTRHMDSETIPLHLKYIYDNEIFKLLL